MHSATATGWFLILAVFLAGITHIAMLPPFEGYDETAHWSYVQEVADTGHVPVYGLDRLSADVEEYKGPMQSIAGQPYQDYIRANPAPADSLSGPTRYRPGLGFNWQAQHPPLFYAAMAPVYWMAARLPWRWHLFALRLASWTLAFFGFTWGALLTRRVLLRRGVADARLLLPIAWPFLFAEFYPEFARLTNDSLCIALTACAWSLALGWLERGASWPRALALGATLGAGLLTKAFFLPITAGLCALLLVANVNAGERRRWAPTVSVPLLASSVGAAWYLAKLRLTGTLTGSADMILLDARGGLLAGLRDNFSVLQYARGIGGIVAGFCWAGTWSFAQASRLFIVPVALLALLPLGRYAWRLARWRLVELTPLFIVAPVVGGLLYHLLGMVASTGIGNGTPGWYLHIFAGPLSLVLALGWAGRAPLWPLLCYAAAFSAAMACMQAAFFSGCLMRVGPGKISLLETAGCMAHLRPLERVALPGVALPAAAATLCALALALFAGARSARPQPGTA